MSTSSTPIWVCGHCGRPVADNPTKWVGGMPFHVECTLSPYAGSPYAAPAYDAVHQDIGEPFAGLPEEHQTWAGSR